MVTKARPKCRIHDFVAPVGKPEAARCADCGQEPKQDDYGDTMQIRYLEPNAWFNTMVKLG